jgi:hypothetical protein
VLAKRLPGALTGNGRQLTGGSPQGGGHLTPAIGRASPALWGRGFARIADQIRVCHVHSSPNLRALAASLAPLDAVRAAIVAERRRQS